MRRQWLLLLVPVLLLSGLAIVAPQAQAQDAGLSSPDQQLQTSDITIQNSSSNITNSTTSEITRIDDWQTFQYDFQRTGNAPTVGPEREQKLLWRKQFPEVESSPAVVNGTVYVGITSSDADWNDGRSFVALNATNGKVRWSFRESSDVKSSPTVVDGIVYFASTDGTVYALDATTGDQIWQFATDHYIEKSLAWDNGTLYVANANGDVYAIDADSGQEIWNVSTHQAFNTAPAVSGSLLIVGGEDGKNQHGALYALNRTTGHELWNLTAVGDIPSSPTVRDDTVYFGSSDRHVYAVSIQNGTIRWKSPTEQGVYASPAVTEESVYVGDFDGYFYAFDRASGEKRWQRAPLGPDVMSAPTVANGTIYVTEGSGNILSLGTRIGAVKWSFETDGYRTRISSSPAVLDGILYVGSGTLGLSRNASVYAIAELPSPSFEVSDRSIQVGDEVALDATNSESRLGDIVQYEWDFDGNGVFDASGAKVTHRFNQPGGYRVGLRVTDSRGVTETERTRVVVKAPRKETFEDEYLQSRFDAENTGYRPNSTGPVDSVRQRWRFDLGVSLGQFSVPTAPGGRPVVSGNHVLVGGGIEDGRIYALHAGYGSIQWNVSPGELQSSQPATNGELVYFGSIVDDTDYLFAYDVTTGEQRWRFELSDTVLAAPTVHAGTVYIGTLDGTLYAIDARTGDQRWQESIGGPITAAPSIHNKTLIIPSRTAGRIAVIGQDYPSTIFALNVTNGQQRWNKSMEESFRTSPATMDGTVYLTSQSGRVYAFNVSHGGEEWNYSTGSRIHSSPAVGDGRVFITTFSEERERGIRSATVYALRASAKAGEERQLWNISVNSSVSPTVVDDIVYIGSRDGRVYGLNAGSGEVVWTFTASERIVSEPVVAHGMIFLSSADGNVYALDSVDIFESNISITEATIAQRDITVGGSTTISVTLTNDGRLAGERPVNLSIDSGVVATKTVTVPPESSVDVTFDREFERAGSYDILVNDQRAGTVVVRKAISPTTNGTGALSTLPAPDPVKRIVELPGFGRSAAISAILLAVLIAVGRNRFR